MTADAGAQRLVAGRYTVNGMLGRGGMGVVWRATDQVLGRPVALKEVTFPAHLTDDEREALRNRTLREARAAARLVHPCVTTLYDVVEEDGRPWLVMEHVESRSLQEIVQREGPLPWRAVARIGLDVLDALEAAHAAGIVHRDVKPANVLVGRDCAAHLTDFGIAIATGGPSITTSGAIIGSPSYMAPERARGEEPGPAVDLWSLGATLYTAVEGRLAFDRPESMATLLAVVSEDPAPTELAGPLAPVLEGLLTKDAAARWDVPRARAALRAVLEGAGPGPEWNPHAQRSGDGPEDGPGDDGNAGSRPTLGGQVERFDIDDLRALASVIHGVARDARDQARYLADRRKERKERKELEEKHRKRGSRPVRAAAARPAAPPAAAPVAPSPAPPVAAPAAPPSRRRPAAPVQRRRFKRRWVVVPVLLAVLAVLAALAGAVALLAAAFGVW
ncbi:serine/threonine-protein kinase [Geodermatophilus normandii]|uniref:non-specific serine/threonine protein kinase n=1 Tax=Geodermatophilus normandii TaxID=1137989 RepID=A0A6P0GIJ4_9ACTN|nr:serine/threonine-protein kinase [Geodermatophilus normandii]NEM07135.1 serine/threonine protein kinase [Geodermatophilus normandii]